MQLKQSKVGTYGMKNMLVNVHSLRAFERYSRRFGDSLVSFRRFLLLYLLVNHFFICLVCDATLAMLGTAQSAFY